MSLEYHISAEEFAEQEYAIVRKLRGERFKLKEHIENYVPKENGELVFRILKDFFLVQAVCYEKTRKTVEIQDSSSFASALQIATGLASVIGERGIIGAPDLRVSFFDNKKIDYQKPFPEPVTDLISIYLESMNALAGRFSLETVTDCFFSWSQESAATFLRREKMQQTYHLISPMHEAFFDPTLVKKKSAESKQSIDFEKYVVSPAKEIQKNQKKEEKGFLLPSGKQSIIKTGKSEIGKFETTKSEIEEEKKEDFIFGHDEVKTVFRELALIIQNKEYFTSLFDERKIFSNYLLVGPPGTGKTTLVSHFANTCDLTFVKVPCVELGSEFYSKTSRNLHEVYESAKRKITEGKTKGVIIFFDEIDHIAKSRGYGMSTENDSLITTLNDHLDGGSSTAGVITIGATNVEHMIDSAILSRFKKIFVGYPETHAELIGIHDSVIRKMETYAKRDLFEKLDYDAFIQFSDTEEKFRSGRTIERILYETAKRKALDSLPKQEMILVTTADVTSTYVLYQGTFQKQISEKNNSFGSDKKVRFA